MITFCINNNHTDLPQNILFWDKFCKKCLSKKIT